MSSIEVCFILDLLKILTMWLSILPIAGGRIIQVFHKWQDSCRYKGRG
ncbi:hypothetical protein [Lacrimispora sp.]|nr:hypothetical protein [Lacrimispora sp.]